MEYFVKTFEAVATLLGIGILGFWIIARRILPASVMDVIPRLVIDIALPCLIFYNIVSGFDPAAKKGWQQLPLIWAVFTATLGAMTFLCRYIAAKKFRSEFTLSLFFQNSLFIPLAVITGMFGMESDLIIDLFLFTMFFPAFLFNTYPYFFGAAGGKEQRKTDWSRIFNPVFIATVLAVAVRLAGIEVYIPDFMMSITNLVGKITIPLIMIIIGGTLYIDFTREGEVHFTEVLKYIVCKNIIFPAAALLVLWYLKLPYNISLIIILESATPPVTAAPIVTERAGGRRDIVNQYITGSFFASIITIPTVLALFHTFAGK